MTAGLRRYLTAPAPPATVAPAVPERCELCSAVIPAEHDHLVDLANRSMPCACRPCHLLFTSADEPPARAAAGAHRFAAVPREHTALPDFALSDLDWTALDVPVRLAFVFVNSSLGQPVALYPSPAGAAESQLPSEVWAKVLARHPYTAQLPPDVLALLLHRSPDGPEAYVVPIDVCYRLVGLVRLHWRGFDGGQEAWTAIDGWLAQVRENATTRVSVGAAHG
ncbi:DUF5947 family protein [Catellatospora coxensis]|uniref:Uncharacterized protein n=1 Tax=Catellatospora coxensis TaxID=310354 RepID=A0A8J3L8X2_9ACTN|nr:DUF5947 family protein [Catellatospora coxensis]GIG11274.1 hypothetical protein Cco03nite_79740 [Catellatospora coxensis]